MTTTKKLTQIAMLGAIIILMSFTPLGYLKIGAVSITFLTIPVAIGAVVLGASGGAILGAVFGITSFIQCFGMDAFGTALFGINPLFTAIMCIAPRVAMGYLCGLCLKLLKRINAPKTVAYAISAFIASALNTVLFVSALILLFGNTEPVKQLGENIWAIIGILITTNSLIEAVVTTILVTLIANAVVQSTEKR